MPSKKILNIWTRTDARRGRHEYCKDYGKFRQGDWRRNARRAAVPAAQAINKRQQAQLDTLAPAGAHQLRGSFFFGGGTRLLVRERRREEHDDRGEEPEAERREEVAAEVALV